MKSMFENPVDLSIKTNVHLLHIGKTGGTSIKEALKFNTSTDYFSLILHSHSVKLRDIPLGEKVIFFLRDPVQRFVSSFYSRQRRGVPRYFRPWTTEETIAFNTFSTPNELAEAITAHNIDHKGRAIAAMNDIRHVKTSFFDWLESDEYFQRRLKDIIFIGFQENLEADFNKLKVILGLPEKLTLPDDDIKAHRNPDVVDKRLSDIARSNLAIWYKKDIDFYQKCKQKS